MARCPIIIKEAAYVDEYGTTYPQRRRAAVRAMKEDPKAYRKSKMLHALNIIGRGLIGGEGVNLARDKKRGLPIRVLGGALIPLSVISAASAAKNINNDLLNPYGITSSLTDYTLTPAARKRFMAPYEKNK